MDNIAYILIETGRKISPIETATGKKKLDLAPLKKLRYEGLIKYLAEGYDNRIRFIAFFLINFLDDVFYNLTGDFPYEDSFGPKTHDIRTEYFVHFGQGLEKIGNTIKDIKDDTELCKIFEEIVVAYLSAIININEAIKNST